jgi:SAM-dependent MidA family methyltransferase
VTLNDVLRAEITARGPITFARYMELALYHPRFGYYFGGGERTGWPGHFLTSPELDPSYGELWAEGFRRVWERCGSPVRFEIVEIGPGTGTFAHAVLEHATGSFGAALSYRLVERSPRARTRQQLLLGDDRLAWSPSLDDIQPFAAGCVFCNEVVDNLPVHLIEGRVDGIAEAYVDVTDDGLSFVWKEPSSSGVASFFAARPAPGTRAEVGLEAVRFVGKAARVVGRGAVVLVDYGDDDAGLLARPGGTLLCYSESGVDDLVLERPGEKDITAHVNWTAIAAALRDEGAVVSGPCSQREVLKDLGIDAIHDRLREAAARARGAEVVRAMSRRQALGALADPSGLGGLGVMEGARAMPSIARDAGSPAGPRGSGAMSR